MAPNLLFPTTVQAFTTAPTAAAAAAAASATTATAAAFATTATAAASATWWRRASRAESSRFVGNLGSCCTRRRLSQRVA
jgi:hypothetical protein